MTVTKILYRFLIDGPGRCRGSEMKAGAMLRRPEIAVLLPCHNEAAAIASVVEGFKSALPDAKIFVYDNASTDATAEAAKTAGANVFHEPRKGKGNVVRRMFADIEADIYVLADGDGTYDAAAAPEMVSKLVDENLDMVWGASSLMKTETNPNRWISSSRQIRHHASISTTRMVRENRSLLWKAL